MKAFRRQLRHCLHTRNQNAISSFNAHQRKELEAVLSGMQDNETLLVESRLPDEQHEYGHVEHSLFVSVRDFRDFINNVAEHEQQSRQRQQPQPQPQNYQHQHVDRESAESAEQTTTDQDPDLNRFTICFDNGMKRVSMYSLSAIPQHLTLHLINKALHAHKPSDESI